MNTSIKVSLLLFSFNLLVTFQALGTKGNPCHHRQNLLKYFPLPGMDNPARKLNQQAFTKFLMPEDDELNRSQQEYATLQA